MASHRHRTSCLAVAMAALCGLTSLTAHESMARADEVSPTGKGIVGGSLLGAEVVTMVESFAGVRSGWAYAVGAVVGAAGGGVGGYFVEQGSSDGRVPTYMLAGGLALVIPAVVLALDGSRYRPENGASEDRAPTGPAAEPGAPGGTVVTPQPALSPPPAAPMPAAPSSPSSAAPPLSLLDVHGGAVRVGVPVPDVRPVFSTVQQRQYGMRAETEMRMPVLHVTF